MLVSLVEARPRPGRLKFGNGVIGATVWLTEFSLIVMLSIVTGATWHLAVYGAAGDVAAYAGVGALTGLLYTLPFAFRSGYRLERLMEMPRSLAHVLNVWTYTFFCLGALAFVTKTTGLASRGWLALFFALGGIGVALGSVAADRAIRYLIKVGYVAPRRLIVVGKAAEVPSFVKRVTGNNSGVQVVSSTVLPDDAPPEQG